MDEDVYTDDYETRSQSVVDVIEGCRERGS